MTMAQVYRSIENWISKDVNTCMRTRLQFLFYEQARNKSVRQFDVLNTWSPIVKLKVKLFLLKYEISLFY